MKSHIQQGITRKCRFITVLLVVGLVFVTAGPIGMVDARQSISRIQKWKSRYHHDLLRVSTNCGLECRGGSSSSNGFGRRPATVNKNQLLSTSTPSSSSKQDSYTSFPIVQDEPDEGTATAKEMMDAFLTRESRNSFIGRTL